MNRRTFLTHSLAGMTLALSHRTFSTSRVSAGPWPEDLGRLEFYRPPQLTVMTGFIKDPQHKHYTVAEWAKGIGQNFDAAALVDRYLKAGIREVLWYDKWIDGLVFRRTGTTSYQTDRDFLGDWKEAIKGPDLKLVTYFNTFYDDNPEFSDWACIDARGEPITFSPFWPQKLLSPYSPFRDKAFEQIRELLEDYDVDGIWLDVPFHPSLSYDSWTQDAFREQYGMSIEKADPQERRRFSIDSAANWNKEVAGYIRSIKPSAVVTTNGFFSPLQSGPRTAISMGEPLDYFSVELHTTERQQDIAPTLQDYDKPVETGTLLSDDWFTPLWKGPMRTSKSPNELRLELARLLGRGLNLWMAVTLAHDGSVDSGTLSLIDEAGSWLKARRPYLQGSLTFANVAFALGRAKEEELDWPGGRGVSGTDLGVAGQDYHTTLAQLRSQFAESGYLARFLIDCPNIQDGEAIPSETQLLIVPDRVNLLPSDAARVEEFVKKGGTVITFGRGGALGKTPDSRPTLHPILGLETSGYLLAGRGGGFTTTVEEETVFIQSVPIQVTVGAAKVIQWMQSFALGNVPLLTENRVGQGRAYHFTVPESELLRSRLLFEQLRKILFPTPLWRFQDQPERYSANLRRLNDTLVLQVLDNLSASEGPMQRYRPAFETISLNQKVLGFSRAYLLPERTLLESKQEGSWLSLELYPNPELMILLE